MSVAGRLGLSRQGARWWCAVVAKPLALPRRPAAASVRGLLIGRHSLPPRTRLDVGTRPLEANQCLAARLFSTQPITSATYRRFGQPPQGSRQGASGGFPVVYEQLGGLRSGGGGSGGNSGNRKGYDSSAKTILVVVVGGAGVYYYVHLERVPDTGRLRFIDISVAQEKALGQESFEQTMRQYRGQILPANDRRVQQVRRVAERIVAAAQAHQEQGSLDANHLAWAGGSATQHADTEWQVFVIQSKEKNAFVLPNGKIFVFSGILPICQDDDGLATVLGHEVAHQIARHMAEKVSGYKVLMFAQLLLQSVAGDLFGAFSALPQLLISLPNSRAVEVEADRIGLRLMSAACFDPRKAPSLWQRMEASEGSREGGISEAIQSVMSTHPLSRKRMESLQEWLPEAMEIRQETGCPSQSTVAGFQSASGNGGIAAFPPMRGGLR